MMSFRDTIFIALGAAVAAGVIFLLDRLRIWLFQLGKRSWRKSCDASTGGGGGFLVGLQKLVEPQARQVSEIREQTILDELSREGDRRKAGDGDRDDSEPILPR